MTERSTRPETVPRHSAVEIAPMLEFAGAPELAERFELAPRLLEDPNAMVPLPVFHVLLEALVEKTGDPHFGLHFGSSIDEPKFKRRVGALGLMLLSSPNMGVGLQNLVRYQNMFNEGDAYAVVERDGETHLCFEAWGPPRLGQIQMAEKTVAQILRMLSLAKLAIEPRAVRFAHTERADVEAITAVIGLEPTFGAECTAVVVDTAVMHRANPTSDPHFFRFFERHLSERGARESVALNRQQTLTEKVAATVGEMLSQGEYSSRATARSLGSSQRTMQRQLAAEGTNVSAVVEGVRRARVQSLLTTAIPIGEIAALLGYSGTAPFVRAFRRWFDTTPAEWRRRARAKRE